MPKLDPALWRDMMSYLRGRHAPICRQWFEDLRPVSLDSGLLRISTSTSVQQNYLQRKCLEQFTEAAQATTGALVAVRFVHDGEAESVSSEEAQGRGMALATAATLPTPEEALGIPGSKAAVSLGASVTAHGAAVHGGGAMHGGANHHGVTMATAPVAAARPAAGPLALTISTPVDEAWAELVFEQPVISPDYSFDTFVSGPGNQLAFAAAKGVADRPGVAYNPLFIHGGVGLGKTHLLQAICQTLLHRDPALKICYLSCDAFINQFIHCVQKGMMDQFRHRYRHVDVLVIDDIHFLGMGNRERTQEEFFHTFNQLHQARKQIVLSSDAAPTEIPALEERLVSRFGWGLVAHIAKPDYETRLAIVHAKTGVRQLKLPEDVVSYIATRIDSNARELEGAITTIQALAQLENRPVDLELAKKALGEPALQGRQGQITLQQIADVVTAYYNVKLADLQSKRRHKSITMPRQVSMWLARKRTRFSLQEIGAFFGGRDHTTVMHSIQMVDDRQQDDAAYGVQLQQLDDRIMSPNKG